MKSLQTNDYGRALHSDPMTDAREIQIGHVVILLFLGACEAAPAERTEFEQAQAESSAESLADRRAPSLDYALVRAAVELADVAYADLGEPYGCTQDCSGHEAGVDWARENEIYSPDDCGGRSQSFLQGCKAYAEAVEQAAELIVAGGR